MTPSGIEPATFQFVAQHLNHCATVVPTYEHFCSIAFWGMIKRTYKCFSQIMTWRFSSLNSQLDAIITDFIYNYNQLNMFRAIIFHVLRSTRQCLQLVVQCTDDAASRQVQCTDDAASRQVLNVALCGHFLILLAKMCFTAFSVITVRRKCGCKK